MGASPPEPVRDRACPKGLKGRKSRARETGNLALGRRYAPRLRGAMVPAPSGQVRATRTGPGRAGVFGPLTGGPEGNPASVGIPLPGGSGRLGLSGRRGLDRAQKRAFVANLADVLGGTTMVVVTHYQGLTVAQATDLRRRMRAAGATFRVAKNRLAMRALDGTQFEGLKPMLKGPTALAWSADPVAVAKAAIEYARSNEKLVVIGGSLGARTLDAAEVRALAELPPLQTLRARILGLIVAPASRLAGTLQAPAGQVARVFGAYAKTASEAAEAPQAA